MSKTEIVAMPSLCDSTDWDLGWDLGNRKMADHLRRFGTLKLVKEIPGGFKFYHNSGFAPSGGAYFAVNASDTIVYFMEYCTNAATARVGKSVTQTKVWISITAGLPRGFVTSVVFGLLLKKHGTVISDKLHTEDGKRLWLQLMGTALVKGYSVALLDLIKNKRYALKTKEQLDRWARDHAGAWAWNSKRHEGLRFLISKVADE